MNRGNHQDNLQDVYHHSIIHKNVFLHINNIGSNLKEIIEKQISHEIEGKCIGEGYIKPHSVSVINYSSGRITQGNRLVFDVVFECDVCLPVEGMLIECTVKNITKAGIRAEVIVDDQESSPLVIFIARDHHIDNKYYNDVVEKNIIRVRVIGQRFELNDKYITIIAELHRIAEPRQTNKPTHRANNTHRQTMKKTNNPIQINDTKVPAALTKTIAAEVPPAAAAPQSQITIATAPKTVPANDVKQAVLEETKLATSTSSKKPTKQKLKPL